MQLDFHDTSRRLSRAVESIRNNSKLPEGKKAKILELDEFLAAKGYSERRRLVYLLNSLGSESCKTAQPVATLIWVGSARQIC